MKKILIISVSAGAGHVRAADAIKKTAEQSFSDMHVKHIDMMDYVSSAMKTAIVDSYGLLAKQIPELWGMVYDRTDTHKTSIRLQKLTKLLNQINARKMFDYVKAYTPDHIISTHFLPSHALTTAPKRWGIDVPVSMVMTDYDKHAMVLAPGMDRYFASSKKMMWKLQQAGIPQGDIINSGIPIDPIFFEKKNTARIKRKLKLPKEGPIILVLSGGEGMGRADKIVEALFAIDTPATIVAIAGNNTKLLQKLKKVRTPGHLTVISSGWVNNVDDYMRVSDVIISKPGGMTSTECMVLKKPLIAIAPLPGQEEANAHFLVEQGRGKLADDYDDVAYYAQEYLARTPHLKMFQKKPAAEIILKTIGK